MHMFVVSPQIKIIKNRLNKQPEDEALSKRGEKKKKNLLSAVSWQLLTPVTAALGCSAACNDE